MGNHVLLTCVILIHCSGLVASSCWWWEFKCGNGACINEEKQCDSVKDCSDGSDEKDCPTVTISVKTEASIRTTTDAEPTEPLGTTAQVAAQLLIKQETAFTSVGPSSDLQTTPGPLVLTTDKCGCDGLPDCECNCTCNGPRCPSSSSPATQSCGSSEFECFTGECIDLRKKCDGQEDCDDGSDERECLSDGQPPRPVLLPSARVELRCSDPSNVYEKKDFLSLTCRFVGSPPPVIAWKWSGGRVPKSCVVAPGMPVDAYAESFLTCLNFEQMMQGEFTCTGSNAFGEVEQAPPTLVQCSNVPQCAPGTMRVTHNVTLCLPCFCSGVSTACHSLPARTNSIIDEFPRDSEDVFFHYSGDVGYVPVDDEPLPVSVNMFERIRFCTLPHKFLRNQLNSYGRSVVLPIMVNEALFLPYAPDVIIRGNGVTLTHRLDRNVLNSMKTKALFWPEHWRHITSGMADATREDIMQALANLDLFAFRCEYQRGKYLSSEGSVVLEVSVADNTTDAAPSFVERCSCPVGHAGLSCQDCETGYQWDKATGRCTPSAHCPAGYSGPDCKECQKELGYKKIDGKCVLSTCSEEYSVGTEGDTCLCKENVAGDACDVCKPGSFHLHPDNPHGCISCYCSGVVKDCTSSNLIMTTIVDTPQMGYNSSQGASFWLLPRFTGSLIESYGGYLVYTMKYTQDIEKQLAPLSVDILSKDNNVELKYIHQDIDTSTAERSKTWRVRMTEKNWLVGGANATRAEFMRVLANVRVVYIESPYSIPTGRVLLSSVSLDTAIHATGGASGAPALSVEQCSCPEGYDGFSCESCIHGYYRKVTANRTTCTPCDHCPNRDCESETGKCNSCPDGEYNETPEDETMVCKPCPCNNCEKRCYKDMTNNVVCVCKEGFFGPKCEKAGPKTELKVMITPHRVIGKPKTKVDFICSYESTEEMTVKFTKEFKDGRKILVDTTENEDMSVKDGFGMLKKATVDITEGLLFVHCSVFDTRQEEVGVVTATVFSDGGFKKPQIIHWTEVLRVTEDDNGDLTCEATGDPEPRLVWEKQVAPDTFVVVPSADGYLRLNDIKLDQNGTLFRCTATSHVGEDRKNKVLIVKEKCPILLKLKPDVWEGEEGDTIVLGCESTPGNLPITWTSEAGSLPNGRSHVEKGVLTIANATTSDSGIYHCTARNELDFVKTKPVTVQVNKRRVAAWARIAQKDVTILEGEYFTVYCQVGGYPEPRGAWHMLDNTPMPANVRQSAVSRGVHLLTIDYASVENTGVYVCTATNWDSNSQRIAITVNNMSPPSVSLEPVATRVKKGEDVTLYCNVSRADPTPTVKWDSDNTDIDSQNIHVNGNVLTIKNSQKSNEGRYHCTATNRAGSDIAYATVQVDDLIKPRVSLTKSGLQLLEGEEPAEEVVCEVEEGSPNPIVTWSRPDGKSLGAAETSGGVIRFGKVSLKDNGDYVCTAENEAGTDTKTLVVDVQSKPVVSVTPEYIEVDRGQTINMTCKAVGNPTPWVSLKQEFGSNGNKRYHVVTQSPGGLKLEMFTDSMTVLINVTERQSGNYICRGVNIHGSDEKTISIRLNKVKPPPTFAETVELGSELEITCPQILNDVIWTKENGHIRRDACIVLPNKLIFNSVQVQDSGTYVCTSVADPSKFSKTIVKVFGYVPKFDRSHLSSMQVKLNTPTQSDRTRVELTFKATEHSGLLFLRQEDPQFFIQLFRLHVVAGPFNGQFIKHKMAVSLDTWNTIILQHSPDRVILEQDGIPFEKVTIGKSLELQKGEIFSIGGTSFTDSPLMSRRHQEYKYNPHWGLSGCISRLLVNNHEYNITNEAVSSTKVHTCRSCAENPCQGQAGQGACIDAPTERGYICVCREGVDCPGNCVGPTCHTSFDLCNALTACHNGGTCQLKRSALSCACKDNFHGHRCEEEELTSIQLQGNGFAEMSPAGLRARFGKENIKLEFTSKTLDGLLLWQGDFSSNYMYLAVVRGRVKYEYRNEGKTLSVESANTVVQDTSHSLVVDRINGTVTMAMDGALVGSAALQDTWHTNRVIGNLFVGGAPDIEEITNGVVQSGFVGCIHQLSFDTPKGTINFAEKTVRRVRIGKCQSDGYTTSPTYPDEEDDDDDAEDYGDEEDNHI